MSWFEKLMPSRISTENRTRSVPEGVWIKCPKCDAQLYRNELERNLRVCPKCDHHMRIGARQRLAFFLDPKSMEEMAASMEPEDPLKFRDSKRYRDRINAAQKATGSRAAAFAADNNVPLVCFAASGGARMQEALFSLLQMAKTSAALARLGEKKVPYVSVLTDPTTGGVSASLAMLGDVNIAEPRALIGFAGPRVIEQTVGQKLPEGFQRSEFLLDHGAVDMIVDRRQMREQIADLLAKFENRPNPIEQ